MIYETKSSAYNTSPTSTLNLFNVPNTINETQLQHYFPSAKKISYQPYGACVLKFHSDRDCEAVYLECQNGKEIDGQFIQAQFGQSQNASLNEPPRNSYENSDFDDKQKYAKKNNAHSAEEGCVLNVHNLCWTLNDDDLMQEFPRAISASVSMNDIGRSRGWGTVTFANARDCEAAESENSGKILNGRPIRLEIRSELDSNRDSNDGYRNRGRNYENRSNDFSGVAQRYNDDRRGYRGIGGHGGGGYGRERDNRRSNDRRDRGDFRRERSRSPERGRGGGGGGRRGGGPGPRGPRITSAVIRRAPGDSSDSDFDTR